MNREIYVTDGEYTLLPISDEDRENYIELHRQLNGEQTLFLNPYCKDMMWEQVLEGKDKVFSIFNCDGEYCGSTEIQRPESDIPEIGIDLLENKRNKGIAPKVVVMLAKRAYQDKPVEYYLIRISSRNPHSKHVFEKLGAVPTANNSSIYVSDAGLTNIVAGHHSAEALSVDEFQRINGAVELEEKDIRHRILVIKINRLYQRGMDEKVLYDAVRGVWRASKEKVKTVEYVFGVYNSLIGPFTSHQSGLSVKRQRTDFQGRILFLHQKQKIDYSLWMKDMNRDFLLMRMKRSTLESR